MKWTISHFKSFFPAKITAFFLGVSCLLSSNAMAQMNSIIFYYADQPPLDKLRAFDVAVINDSLEIQPHQYNDSTSQLFAYVSVGEARPEQIGPNKIHPSWIMGKNSAWKSAVIDLTNSEWQHYFIEKMINPLWEKGYRGFFFDTLDSYQLVVSDPVQQAAQQQALINVISELKQQHPSAQIILNRGFEIMARVNQNVIGVAAESLFAKWDESQKSYLPVPQPDRDYLLDKFDEVEALGLIPIAIDYVPEDNVPLAKEIAQKISALKIIPYVGNNYLQNVGVSNGSENPDSASAVSKRP